MTEFLAVSGADLKTWFLPFRVLQVPTWRPKGKAPGAGCLFNLLYIQSTCSQSPWLPEKILNTCEEF